MPGSLMDAGDQCPILILTLYSLYPQALYLSLPESEVSLSSGFLRRCLFRYVWLFEGCTVTTTEQVQSWEGLCKQNYVSFLIFEMGSHMAQAGLAGQLRVAGNSGFSLPLLHDH